jgi:hypothetical protein
VRALDGVSQTAIEGRSDTALPRAIDLLGPDVILLAMETRAMGRMASSNAILVIELDAPLDAARVRSALERFLPHCPWLGGRLERPFPWGKLRWRVPSDGPTMPSVTSKTLAAGELTTFVDQELETPIDPRRAVPLRMTVANDGTAARLVCTWAHALMDPHGAEHLVRLLAELDERPGVDSPWATPPIVVAPADARPLRERGALASRGAAELRALAPVPPRSLAAVHATDHPGTRRHWRFRFAASAPPAERLRRGMPWRLAVVAKAMAALFLRRGVATDAPFLVPISVDRRARGEPGPVLGNYLGFHFARARLPVDGDTPALRDQLADAVRRDEIEANWAGMSFARYRPLRGMFRELPWARAGDFCSFNFADTDALLPDRTHLFGARIAGGYHVAAVPARPGAGVFFTRRDAIESLIVSTADDVLDDADAAIIADVVQREMGWKACD